MITDQGGRCQVLFSAVACPALAGDVYRVIGCAGLMPAYHVIPVLLKEYFIVLFMLFCMFHSFSSAEYSFFL